MKSVGISESNNAQTSANIRQRIENARQLQRRRYDKGFLNGNVPAQTLLATCQLSDRQSAFLKEVYFTEIWSNRTQVKLIRIARILADLADDQFISDDALQEAVDWKRTASLYHGESTLVGENG
ncbi:hypothetical protein [Sporosarcina sp. YIM B06819]|uniref:magnesium chelatase subunit ChlI family protein n=1 Tax=Sporosarcina sp. YIM B06819 TaxID=3081769 RepID=UPI00298BE067|nr:hypothetical protein [Sporosarcina sp. YIM B06819]